MSKRKADNCWKNSLIWSFPGFFVSVPSIEFRTYTSLTPCRQTILYIRAHKLANCYISSVDMNERPLITVMEILLPVAHPPTSAQPFGPAKTMYNITPHLRLRQGCRKLPSFLDHRNVCYIQFNQSINQSITQTCRCYDTIQSQLCYVIVSNKCYNDELLTWLARA